MAKDGRELREEAAAATAAGKHKRALAAYLELERIEPAIHGSVGVRQRLKDQP